MFDFNRVDTLALLSLVLELVKKHQKVLGKCLRSSSNWGHLTSFSSRSEGLGHAKGASTRFMVASGGVLCEEYGHDGPGVCLADGKTEAYLKDTGMMGLASAWAMARRRPI